MKKLKQEIESQLHRAALAVEAALDRGREAVGGAFSPGVEDVEHIAAYRGYATAEKLIVSGRLLANPPADESRHDDQWWDNLGSLWRRIQTREVPGAEVVLRHAGEQHSVVSDEEGYYHCEFDLPPEDAAGADALADGSVGGDIDDVFWSRISAEVPGSLARARAEHSVLRPPADARFGIISDMDDTVIHTGATHLLLMARQTLFGNARLCQPLAGVAALYRALQHEQQRRTNPLFYVSSSPWNLYDLLEEFLAHNGIPPGPILLRDYGIDETKLGASRGHGHKLEKAERILRAYPQLPFVLIGDSGQDDAEIYAEAARRYPERIRAIYIRDVDPDKDTEFDARADRYIEVAARHGVPMLRARDSLAMAAHAAELDLIREEDVRNVAADVESDRQKPATVGEAIEQAGVTS